MSRAPLALVFVAIMGCGAASTELASLVPAVPAVRYLEVDGAVAHPTPVDALDDEIVGLHEEFEALVRSEIELPVDRSAEAIQVWTREVLGPFLAAHRARLAAFEQHALPMLQRADPADRRFGAILVARAWERLHALLTSVPAPDSIAGDAELAATYRDALARTGLPLAHRAGDAYRVCANQDPVEGTDEWTRECEARAQRLRALEEPAPRPTASSSTAGEPPASGEPFGVIGVLRSDGDRDYASVMIRTCESDADCDEGRTCEQLGSAVTQGGEPLMACAVHAQVED